MVPGELQQVVSDALGYPFPTVSIYARRLREAGVLTRAGRGKSAPQMETADAARLLVSLLGSTGVNDAVTALERAETFRPQPGRRIGFLSREGDEAANGIDIMDWLLQGYISGDIARYHESVGGSQFTLGSSVRLTFPLNGRRSMMLEYVPGIRGVPPEKCVLMAVGDVTPNPDYRSVNYISGVSLKEIAARFAG